MTGASQQLVTVVDIGLVVQVVMEFEGFLAHAASGESVMGIRQVGEFKSHGFILSEDQVRQGLHRRHCLLIIIYGLCHKEKEGEPFLVKITVTYRRIWPLTIKQLKG